MLVRVTWDYIDMYSKRTPFIFGSRLNYPSLLLSLIFFSFYSPIIISFLFGPLKTPHLILPPQSPRGYLHTAPGLKFLKGYISS